MICLTHPFYCKDESDGSERDELKLVQRQRVGCDPDKEAAHHRQLEEDPKPLPSTDQTRRKRWPTLECSKKAMDCTHRRVEDGADAASLLGLADAH